MDERRGFLPEVRVGGPPPAPKVVVPSKRGRPPATMSTAISHLARIAHALEVIAGIPSPRIEFVDPNDARSDFIAYSDDSDTIRRELAALEEVVGGVRTAETEDEALWAALARARYHSQEAGGSGIGGA